MAQTYLYLLCADKSLQFIFSFSVNSTDAPDRVELNAKNVTLLTGSSTTLTCSARASPAANYRFISVNGSNETTVQDSASPTYKTPSLDYNNFNNYKAIYRCIPYNMYGNGPAQNITLDIQGNYRLVYSILPPNMLMIL